MKTLVISSGYFSPLCRHHCMYLEHSGELGNTHIVIVNTDRQVALKGSIPFFEEYDRLHIVQGLRCVDNAVLAIDKDRTVCETLRLLHAINNRYHERIIFTNGGDVTECAEKDVCEELGIELAYNVGGGKTGSSSNYIEKCAIEWIKRNQSKAWSLLCFPRSDNKANKIILMQPNDEKN
jgi:glycerol-3-phosphate cytidylyltransferase-like family protein